jgi:uncharacterized protein YjbI with pentapeptide repeats
VLPDLSTPYAVSPGFGKISEPDTDVAKAGLSGMNLSGINFSATNLSGTNLNSANLSDANLFAADLRFADLREAQLVNAKLGRANLIGADLYGADFNQVVIGDSVASGQKPTLRADFVLSAVYLPYFHQEKSILSVVEVPNWY